MTFTLQGFGPFLEWMTLVVLCALPVIAAAMLYKLGGLPGSIAAGRGHPQARAINVCGWMGLITLVMWPIAMVWAYLKTEHEPLSEGGQAAKNPQSVIGGLHRASQRLAAIEASLTKPIPNSGSRT
jgi:hypothetical protein